MTDAGAFEQGLRSREGRAPEEHGREGVVLAIFGPTASGKSAVAEALAERIPAEIVSADAMQAYRGLPILTNQPERPTRLVGIWSLEHEGSVGEFQRLAHAAVDEIIAAERTPIVAGGTGLYLRAALAELELPPSPPPGARERWELFYDEVGAETAYATLAEHDPAAAAAVHPNDRRRVVRALELADLGSSLVPATNRLWTEDTRHPTVIFGLEVPAEILNRRIDERTSSMVERGVEDEVARALAAPALDGSPEGDRARGFRDLAAGGSRRRGRAEDTPVRRLPAQMASPPSRRC